MKILILATDIYTRGGIARHTYTFASTLADLLGPENVHLLALLAYGDPADLPPRFRILGPVSKRLTAAAKARFALKALAVARNKYDLIVCSHLGLVPVAAAIHFVYRTPFWVACYGREAWGPLPLFKRVALRQSNLLLPMSRFTGQKLSEVHKISPPRMFILQTSIPTDLERLLTAPAGAGGLEASVYNRGRILLSVGSLTSAHAYKGFDTVIRALPAALERVPNIKYVIIGEGDDRPRLEKLVSEYQLGTHVIFAGSVSDEQLAKYYRSCDVFVLPSKTTERNGSWQGEGFGRVYVEAALAGKPVVGSLGGGAAEAVLHGETGILVDPTSVEETASAIITLLENPTAAEQMGQKGRKWAIENFTEDALRKSLGGLLHACGSAQVI
ncbi:MAG: glycosyltransferase family 4 protein [Terriglobia bacterium]